MAKKKINNLPFGDIDPDAISKKEYSGKTPFVPGNQFWKNRDPDNAGRPKAIESPEVLWNHFKDYQKQVDDNPWIMIDFKGKDASRVEMPKQLPYTWTGFDNYLFENKIISDLDDYKANKKKRYADFSEVITRIEKFIYDHKYSGATINAFNASIIARDLKLVDASDITTGGKKLGSSPSKIEIEIVRSKDEDE